MIDLHTHILPGIDDGSRDIEESAKLIEAERQDGVTVIVATPHFYAQRVSVGHFLERRENACRKVEEWAKAQEPEQIPKILTGAEVYYFPGIGQASQVAQLTTQGTNTLLLEMPFAQWNRQVVADVEDLIQKQRLRIILAHTERFLQFQKDKACWNRILDMDLLLQFNAENIISRNGLFGPDRKKKFCLDHIRSGRPFLLGSDCHNMRDRRPNLRQARDEIEKQFGDGVLEASDRLAEEVIRS